MTDATEAISAITEETEHLGSLASQAIDFLRQRMPSLVAALVVLLLGLVITNLLTKGMTRAIKRTNADPTAVGFVQSFIRVALYVLVGVIVLSVLQVPMASIVTVIGTMGLAVVLGLQNSLSNVAGGILLLFSRPLKVGDFVETSGVSGTVDSITILQTKLRRPDGTSVFIPNGKISDAVVLNYSEDPRRRLDLKFSICYDADAANAKDLIAGILLKSSYVLKDTPPLIRIGELGDSAVILHVQVWTMHVHYWDLYYDLHEQVKAAFDENGIGIPYPQMDVHMK